MKKWLVIALGLIAIGIVLLIIPAPGAPDLVCAPEGTTSSGFVDPDQNDCPVTIESWTEYADWQSGPRWDNIAGLALIVVGIGIAVYGFLSGRKKTADPTTA